MIVERSPYPPVYSPFSSDQLINTNPLISLEKKYFVYSIALTKTISGFPYLYYGIREDEDGQFLFTPNALWQIVDQRIPPNWNIKKRSPLSIAIEHPVFSDEYFVDDLTDYDPDALQKFSLVTKELETYHRSDQSGMEFDLRNLNELAEW